MERGEEQKTTRGEHSELYTLEESNWPNQVVRRLSMQDGSVKASFIYILPFITNLVPIIGYVTCACSRLPFLSAHERHRAIMLSAFTNILRSLAFLGHGKVRCPARLLQSPPCLASQIENFHIIKGDENEFTITLTSY